MRMTWDAIVIGAGPAGAATALGLNGRGRRVLLLERHTFPRDKVCGGCVNASALRELDALGLAKNVAALHAPVLSRLVLHGGGAPAHVSIPAGIGVTRAAFDQMLVEAARERGVTLRTGQRAQRVGPGAVAVDGRIERADVVVAAGGLANAQPDITTRTAPRSRIGAQTFLEHAPAFCTPDAIDMVCGRHGYVGFAQTEDGRCDIAAALAPALVRQSGGIAHAVQQILVRAGLPPLTATRAWSATPALTKTPCQRHGDRLFLVGDAAGYVEPFTGEGIAWALAGARALAPIAARAWRPEAGAAWERAYKTTVGKRQRVCRALTHGLRVPHVTAAAVAVLRRAPRIAQPLVRAATLGSAR